MTPSAQGPVLFAYDGSPLAKLAIDEAAEQLMQGRDALVLTVFKTFDLGFIPAGAHHFDTASVTEVEAAAQETAAEGASLAHAAGFRARSMAKEASPTWKGIIEVADAQDARLIVLGSHGRSGFPDVLLGSVAEAVAAHSKRPVLIAHRRS